MKYLEKILITLYVAMLLLLAAATGIERMQGTASAHTLVYGSGWFFCLWTVLAVVGVIVMIRRGLHRRLAVATLHAAFVVILAGAALTWFTGRSGQMHLRCGEPAGCSLDGADLPFLLRLDRFETVFYPGTQTPQDFVSHIRIIGASGDSLTAKVSVNHPADYRGYRLYQASFDPDRQGSVLLVKYDPWGSAVTYFGYLLLGIGMVAVLLSRKAAFIQLLHHPALRKTALVLAGGLFFVQQAPARSLPTISAEKAATAARMEIVYNGRVCPFNTMAQDVLLKVYGKKTYKGLCAEQVVYGWMAAPEIWQYEPLIRIKDRQLCRELQLDGDYAGMADLMDEAGQYKLTAMAAGEHPSKWRKSVRELDEKAGILLMLAGGQLFQAAEPAPTDKHRIDAELFYNRIPFCKLLFMVNLTIGFLACFFLFYCLIHPRPGNRYGWLLLEGLLAAALLFHSLGYALRWYISGHIPLSNGHETMLFMAGTLMLLTLLMQRRLRFLMPFGWLLSGFCLLVAWLSQKNPQITPLMPVLQSPLLSAHVSIIMASYALLAVMTLNALLALLLRRIRPADTPAFEQLTVLNRLLLYPAVFLLAAGIFLGAVWANISWGSYWSWDPKEVWALITMMVYGAAFHRRIPIFGNDKSFNLYLVLAFLSVLMTYFGVNYFLGGMHAYA